jgi:Uma2 family endonuclease
MTAQVLAVEQLATAEEYLRTSFEHDAEFVEGRIVERPLPTWEHARIQTFLVRALWPLERRLGLFAVAEQRVQTQRRRYRVPDVCFAAAPGGPFGRRIVTDQPHLCVEILSPEDSTAETMEKVREYLEFGVEWVWVIDPALGIGQIHGQTGSATVTDGIFSTPKFSINLADAEL